MSKLGMKKERQIVRREARIKINEIVETELKQIKNNYEKNIKRLRKIIIFLIIVVIIQTTAIWLII